MAMARPAHPAGPPRRRPWGHTFRYGWPPQAHYRMRRQGRRRGQLGRLSHPGRRGRSGGAGGVAGRRCPGIGHLRPPAASAAGRPTNRPRSHAGPNLPNPEARRKVPAARRQLPRSVAWFYFPQKTSAGPSLFGCRTFPLAIAAADRRCDPRRTRDGPPARTSRTGPWGVALRYPTATGDQGLATKSVLLQACRCGFRRCDRSLRSVGRSRNRPL